MNTPSTKTFSQIYTELQELLDQDLSKNISSEIPDDVEKILELLTYINDGIEFLPEITFKEVQTKLDYRQKFNQYIRDNFFNPTKN